MHQDSYFELPHIAKCLLEDGQQPNMQDDRAQNPLHYAVNYGHPLMAKLLLETNKVDIDARDSHGSSE